jgi:Lrp/AsnC family transcriptional regulator, leucine-responsive regulatory protein
MIFVRSPHDSTCKRLIDEEIRRAYSDRMTSLEIDDVDRAILDLLRENARRTVADIATRVNLSAAPVKRRIERLERLGVILGYTLQVDHERLEGSVEAFTELRFMGNTDIGVIIAIASEIPEVQEVFTTAGDPDALVRIRVRDVPHLKHVVNRLRTAQPITGTKTLMVLDRWSRAGAASG